MINVLPKSIEIIKNSFVFYIKTYFLIYRYMHIVSVWNLLSLSDTYTHAEMEWDINLLISFVSFIHYVNICPFGPCPWPEGTSFTFTFTGILWRAVKQHQLTGKLLWRGFHIRPLKVVRIYSLKLFTAPLYPTLQ